MADVRAPDCVTTGGEALSFDSVVHAHASRVRWTWCMPLMAAASFVVADGCEMKCSSFS